MPMPCGPALPNAAKGLGAPPAGKGAEPGVGVLKPSIMARSASSLSWLGSVFPKGEPRRSGWGGRFVVAGW
jgi:hypothetical protein